MQTGADSSKNGTTQIFSGLVKCADCGWSLSYGDEQAEQQALRPLSL